MAQRLQVNDCTTGLVALLTHTLAPFYLNGIDVREAGRKDFDDAGQLVLHKVAVRVRFGDAVYAQARDISLTTLSATLNYQIICRHESLRTESEMRNRTLALCECVMEQLAGARFKLADGTVAGPVLVKGVVPVSDSYGPVEDCFGVTIEISGFAAFAGPNAQVQTQAVVA